MRSSPKTRTKKQLQKGAELAIQAIFYNDALDDEDRLRELWKIRNYVQGAIEELEQTVLVE